MDLSAIESGWLQWEAGRREAALNLQTKLQAKDQALQSALAQAEVACCSYCSSIFLLAPQNILFNSRPLFIWLKFITCLYA